jgi:hypothetical protein
MHGTGLARGNTGTGIAINGCRARRCDVLGCAGGVKKPSYLRNILSELNERPLRSVPESGVGVRPPIPSSGIPMHRLHRTALLLALALLPCLAGAQTPYREVERRLTPEQLRETGLDALSPTQLALLNRLLREDAEREAAAAPPAPVAAPAYASETPGRDDAGLLEGAADGPIRSRLIGDVAEWAPGTVFALENGQHWRVLKGSLKLHKPMQAPSIVVVPGVSGRWFLQVDEDLPKARVQRIK